MTSGARWALLAFPLLDMMVGSAAHEHDTPIHMDDASGHEPEREMHMDGVRFAMKINGLSSDGLWGDRALKSMVMQQASYKLVHLCEVDASAVTVKVLRGPILLVGIVAPHSKVMEIRNMIHAAVAAPARDSSITQMVVDAVKLIPHISEVRSGQISAGPVQSWGPYGSPLGARLIDTVTILMEIKGLSLHALKMYQAVEVPLMGKLMEMCAMLSDVPYDHVTKIDIGGKHDDSSVVVSFDVVTSAAHGEWLRHTLKSAAPLQHEDMLVGTIRAVPHVEMVLHGPIRAGELHVVPREDAVHDEGPPCSCAKVWKWMGKTFHGCSETPDWVGKLWCMTMDNDRCHAAMPSTVDTGKHWMECPNGRWQESGGWTRMWSEGDEKHSSHGEWHKVGAKESQTSELGHMRSGHTKSSTQGVDAMESPAARGQKMYSDKHSAGMQESSSQAGHQWMAGTQREHNEHGQAMRKLDHGGIMKSKHSHMKFEEKSTKVNKRGPASKKAGVEELVDCSMWEKLLGNDACLMMHASQGEGRRLGGVLFV